MFDADAFMNQQTSGPMSTQIIPCPEGEWTAKVSDGDNFVTFREVNTKNGPRPICRINYEVLDDSARQKVGRDRLFVIQDIWLDTTSSGQIDTSEGKNVKLGQLRQALGQNDGSWSFPMLKGAGPLMVRVSQRSDPDDPQTKYAEVQRVAKIS